MITIAMATTVDGGRGRVWRALTDPSQLTVWNPGRIASVNSLDGYPTPGQLVRWHCRIGRVPVLLEERPLEVVPGEHLHSAMSLGPFRFESTYTLVRVATHPARTQLGLRMVADNVIPVAGGVLDRFEVRRLATRFVTDTLDAFRIWFDPDGAIEARPLRCEDPLGSSALDPRIAPV